MGLEVNTREFDRLMNKLESSVTDAFDNTGTNFKNITPVRTGNARNRTKHSKDKIEANYPYAARLDEGYSRQAPQGMTEPSINYFVKTLQRLLGRI